MKELHSKTVLLLVLLIGFSFIAIGLTLTSFYLETDPTLDPCLAGLPWEPESLISLLWLSV